MFLTKPPQQSEDVPHNMIAACRMNGMSAQKAFDVVGSLLESRFRRWDELEAQVPKWENSLDDGVQKYIKGIKCVVQANISWR